MNTNVSKHNANADVTSFSPDSRRKSRLSNMNLDQESVQFAANNHMQFMDPLGIA